MTINEGLFLAPCKQEKTMPPRIARGAASKRGGTGQVATRGGQAATRGKPAARGGRGAARGGKPGAKPAAKVRATGFIWEIGELNTVAVVNSPDIRFNVPVRYCNRTD